jgi:alginate O-acetyltransferase complex protein AlgI
MLFNSYIFILGFLPVVLAGFYALGARRQDWALLWLTAASLVFYAWWRPLNILLIAPSILINYGICRILERSGSDRPGQVRAALIAGIVFNLCFLGYFKYFVFGEQALNDLFGTGFVLQQVVLPLGISFITFQKIALLVDVHAGRISRFTLREYALFVLFFPQLIAGPIVHFREMMPQFRAAPCRFDAEDASVGLSLFFFGLGKKLILADPIGSVVGPLYQRAALGVPQSMMEAWIAALGFTLQIYFDFSGYCDMALGLARFFGIKLPVNFNSPLKARSVIDFWSRWHVTLTRFLTAYLYMPLTLAMMRRRATSGKPTLSARDMGASAFVTVLALPTIFTMLVSGIWHGAGYTFILWGLLHGVMLCINHAWRLVRPRVWRDTASYNRRMAPIAFLLTFVSVVFAMVLFRASSVEAAVLVWKGMIGTYGATLPQAVLSRLGAMGGWLQALGVHPAWTSGSLLMGASARIFALSFVALALPNTLELLAAYEPALGVKPAKNRGRLLVLAAWRPSGTWAVGLAGVALAGVLSLGGVHEFLYWQF